MTAASCVPLDRSPVGASRLGGKADGLIWLHGLGLDVPTGFAVTGATGADDLPPDLDEWITSLGDGPLAVRSSAADEDGADHSFAGQFESHLGLVGTEATRGAILACLESANTDRVAAYRAGQHTPEAAGPTMNVVVQRLVEAAASGVVFTADVTSGRRDLVLLDVVGGLGEDLMAGSASPDRFVIRCGDAPGSAEVLVCDPVGDDPVITPAQARSIALTARSAADTAGHPLDAEWAIDEAGTTWWVQARPVTALPPDPTELDDRIPDDHVLTRANVGEMMPGPVCPLTHDVTARGIELASQDIQAEVGVVEGRDPDRHLVPMVLGHLFLDLTELGRMGSQSIGGNADVMARAITGRVLPELVLDEPPPWRIRGPRAVRYVKEILSTGSHARRIQRVRDRLRLEPGVDAATTWRVIDHHRADIIAAYDDHLGASSAAGALAPTMLEILAGGAEPEPVHHAALAHLLAGANAESGTVVSEIESLTDLIRDHPDGLATMQGDPSEIRSWLESPSSGVVGTRWSEFIATHGHRSVRELDLRQPEWAHDPTPVIDTLVASLASGTTKATGADPLSPQAAESALASADADRIEEVLSGTEGRIVKGLAGAARRAVRLREASKSVLVDITVAHKRAYRALGDQLVAEGRLGDADLVFFCTHSELGALAMGDAPALWTTAEHRRQALAWQETLRFPDVVTGRPEPLTSLAIDPSDDLVTGVPANGGRAVGRARVITELGRATELTQGDILVTQVTDVGWTPWFGVVAGVVTDVGSSVSHGAVVAREYGIPAVVNTGDGTLRIVDGERVEIDGTAGLVRRLDV